MEPGLPNPVILLFNKPVRGILPKLNRLPILIDYGSDNCCSYKKWRRSWYKNIPFLSSGSTVVVGWEDRGSWMHGAIVGYRSDDHNGRSYKVQVTKIGHIKWWMKKHVKSQITVEKYLGKKWQLTDSSNLTMYMRHCMEIRSPWDQNQRLGMMKVQAQMKVHQL